MTIKQSLIAALLAIAFAALSLNGCASRPPKDINNLCSIFEDKDDWYNDALDSQKRWGTPIQIQMAIIKQESSFHDDAQPPRTKLLGFIPWTRPSSSYGYSQAQDGTWDWYIKSTGNRWADRDDFEDAIDFVGWYTDVSQKKLGISKWDAYNQYLAYHEGHGGFKKKSYRKKSWLISTAKKVDRQAKTYASQLKGCESELKKGWSIWPF